MENHDADSLEENQKFQAEHDINERKADTNDVNPPFRAIVNAELCGKSRKFIVKINPFIKDKANEFVLDKIFQLIADEAVEKKKRKYGQYKVPKYHLREFRS